MQVIAGVKEDEDDLLVLSLAQVAAGLDLGCQTLAVVYLFLLCQSLLREVCHASSGHQH